MIPLTSLPTAAAITAASAPAAPLNQLLVIVHCCDINHQVARQERRFAQIFPSVKLLCIYKDGVIDNNRAPL